MASVAVVTSPSAASSSSSATAAAEKLPRFTVDLVDHDAVVRVFPDIVCAICQDILLDPVETERCHHSFCRDCITAWLNKRSTCPSDNSPLTTAQLRSISESNPGEYRRTFSNLRIRCPLYADKGCPWVGSYPDMDSHIRTTCIIHAIPCEYCSTSMPRGNLQLHRAACPSRPSQCPHCTIPMPFTAVEAHIEKDCTRAQIPCSIIPANGNDPEVKGCGLLIIRAAMADHHLHECPKAHVSCSLSLAKCTVRVPRERLAEHITTALPNHMLLLMAAVAEQNRTIADQARAISSLQQSNDTMMKELKELKEWKTQAVTPKAGVGMGMTPSGSFIMNGIGGVGAIGTGGVGYQGTAPIHQGKHILIAGGEVGSKAVDNMHLYDIHGKSWTVMPSMPIPRRFAISASMTMPHGGSDFFVAGGYRTDDDMLSTVCAFSWQTRKWRTDIPPMSTARYSAAAAVMDGRLYVVGGFDAKNQPLSSAEVYDPRSNTWSTLQPMSTPRGYTTAVAVRERLYVIGGSRHWNQAPFALVEAYDPITQRWSSVPSITNPRMNAAAVPTPGGGILVVGGRATSFIADPLQSCELFDPSTGRWTPCVWQLPKRMGDLVAHCVDSYLYIFGGVGGDSRIASAEVWCLQLNPSNAAAEPATRWQQLPNLPSPICAMSSAVIY